MTNIVASNVIFPGKYNNYVVGGTVCNGFAVGSIGSITDFFIVASEPEEESNYPLITGNFLDSEGNVLFRLVENTLSVNPGKCQKILSDHVGYEIVDSNGVQIIKVQTLYERLPELGGECFVTTIEGQFHDSSGSLVAQAGGAEGNITLAPSTKSAIGLGVGGSFGIVQNFENEELELLRFVVGTKGKVHKVLSGSIESQSVSLDGCLLSNVSLNNCDIQVVSGEFVLGDSVSITNCRFSFYGPAGQIKMILEHILAASPSSASQEEG